MSFFRALTDTKTEDGARGSRPLGVAALDGRPGRHPHAGRGQTPPLELREPLDGPLPGLLRADPLRQAAAPRQEENSIQEAGTGSESLEEGETRPSVWPGSRLEAGRPSQEDCSGPSGSQQQWRKLKPRRGPGVRPSTRNQF